MPRLYYRELDLENATRAFVAHRILFVTGLVFLWARFDAGLITALWAAGLAYHAYWYRPMNDWDVYHLLHPGARRTSLQRETYDRLRARLGEDWDLNASIEEFDRAHQQAISALKLDFAPVCLLPVLGVIGVVWVLGSLFAGRLLGLEIFVWHVAGVGGVYLSLQITLRRRMRENRRWLKEKHKKMAAHIGPKITDAETAGILTELKQAKGRS